MWCSLASIRQGLVVAYIKLMTIVIFEYQIGTRKISAPTRHSWDEREDYKNQGINKDAIRGSGKLFQVRCNWRFLLKASTLCYDNQFMYWAHEEDSVTVQTKNI